MSRPQLLDADQAPITSQQYFAGGDPGPIVAALATVPELLGPTLNFVGAALGPGSVSVRAKELAILRTSVLQGCRSCKGAGTAFTHTQRSRSMLACRRMRFVDYAVTSCSRRPSHKSPSRP